MGRTGFADLQIGLMDRECQSMFRLKVVASGGTFVTKAKVTIEILDDNDNAPECTRPFYNLKLSEDVTPGYFMGKIEVTDMDENAKQLFSLGGADAMASIELVDHDMLDARVIVRFADVSLEDFILNYQMGFVKIIKNILNVILSMHNAQCSMINMKS